MQAVAKRKFLDFLNSNGITHEFRRNYNNCDWFDYDFDVYLDRIPPRQYILMAFSWDENETSDFYWAEFDYKWEKICDQQ